MLSRKFKALTRLQNLLQNKTLLPFIAFLISVVFTPDILSKLLFYHVLPNFYEATNDIEDIPFTSSCARTVNSLMAGSAGKDQADQEDRLPSTNEYTCLSIVF